MVFQQLTFTAQTALQQYYFGTDQSQKQSRKRQRKIALDLIAKVGIPEKVQSYPAQLSGGQQQRVAIARHWPCSPRSCFSTNPLRALDPEMINEVLDVMVNLAARGMTMMWLLTKWVFRQKVAHRIIFMDEGKIIREAHPAPFFSSKIVIGLKYF